MLRHVFLTDIFAVQRNIFLTDLFAVLRHVFLTDFTDFTDFSGGVERVVKQLIISLSEAGRVFEDKSVKSVRDKSSSVDYQPPMTSRGGIQPERLNAEGEARVLLAGG